MCLCECVVYIDTVVLFFLVCTVVQLSYHTHLNPGGTLDVKVSLMLLQLDPPACGPVCTWH